MNKEHAENRIKAIEKEAEELRKLINEPKEYEPEHADYGYDNHERACFAGKDLQGTIRDCSNVIHSNLASVECPAYRVKTKVGNILEDLEVIKKQASHFIARVEFNYISNRELQVVVGGRGIFNLKELKDFALALRQHTYQMEKNNEKRM